MIHRKTDLSTPMLPGLVRPKTIPSFLFSRILPCLAFCAVAAWGLAQEAANPGQVDPAREAKIQAHRSKIGQLIQDRRDLTNPKTVASIRERAATGRPYALGDVAKASPEGNRAERFACGANSYSIKDILVFPDTAKAKMVVYVVFDDESFEGQTGDMATTRCLEFSPAQKNAVRIFLKWEPKDGKTDLWFQVKANDAFGEEVGVRTAAVRQEVGEVAVGPPKPGEDPKERSEKIQESMRNRMKFNARVTDEIETLKNKYKMRPDW